MEQIKDDSLLCSSRSSVQQRKSEYRNLRWRTDSLPFLQEGESLLALGNRQSHGDSCLNRDGISLDTRCLNHLISFDSQSNILRCESGVMLADIYDQYLPRGWMLPVTPATKWITIGGAIANDVHGTNHHRRGSFGNHVVRLALRRTGNEVINCSRTHNAKLFHATIGGLGLTGVILWADILLRPIDSDCAIVKHSRFESLEEFTALSNNLRWKYEYLSAWLDCANKKKFGRGVMISANLCEDTEVSGRKITSKLSRFFPDVILERIPVKLRNRIYFHAHPENGQEKEVCLDQLLFREDRIRNVNHRYGKNGSLQYQCVVPVSQSESSLQQLLDEVADSGITVPKAELRVFGKIEAKGMISFPRRGISLSMEFPNRGASVLSLFDRMDDIVADAGGAVYPAKDTRMSARHFRTFFPRLNEFMPCMDRRFSSAFWRRISQ